jgi:glycosyltransferase involved in cell wall biosynthesis
VLTVIETHPIQYHAPVYAYLQQVLGIPVTAVYGSDFSVVGYRDPEFNTDFAWDTELVSGYKAIFLSRCAEGGATNDREVKTKGLESTLFQLQPLAILTVGYSPRFHWEAFLSARRTGRPLLFRGETTDHARRRTELKSWLRDAALRRLYRECSALMYVGQRSREHFHRLGLDPARLFSSPYCVDTIPFRTDDHARDDLREPTRRDIGIEPNDLVIAFSGKLSPRKGPKLLIEAVRRLPAEIRDRCAVLLIGDGELREELHSLGRISPCVRLKEIGFQNQTSLSRFYHAADLLVLPSLHSETWGLVVNEALHHGLPVVVSDAVGCAPDLVEAQRTGEVFAAGSIRDLTNALLRALRLVGDQQVRLQCRAKVEGYTVAKAAEGIAEAYHAAVSAYATF